MLEDFIRCFIPWCCDGLPVESLNGRHGYEEIYIKFKKPGLTRI